VEPQVLPPAPASGGADLGPEPSTRTPLAPLPPAPPSPAPQPSETGATEPLAPAAPALAQEPPRALNPVAKRDPAQDAKPAEHGKRVKAHARATADETAPTILARLTEEIINQRYEVEDATMLSCYLRAVKHGPAVKVDLVFDVRSSGRVKLTGPQQGPQDKSQQRASSAGIPDMTGVNPDIDHCVKLYVKSIEGKNLPAAVAPTIFHKRFPTFVPNGK
jgi:hypothetical protein